MKKPPNLRTWIEIDTKAIRHNYKTFRAVVPKETKLMAVVKSNAYGHDIFQFAKFMESLNIDWLGVDSITEAIALRQEGIKTPILVLGYTLPANFPEAVKNDISLTISSFESLLHIRRFAEASRFNGLAKRAIKIHLKIDTGMHRQGFLEKNVVGALAELKNNKNVLVEGIYTHFASTKDPKPSPATKRQLSIFKRVVKKIKELEVKAILHAGATGGTLSYSESHLDMVRIGIGFYGIYPSDKIEKALAKKIKLQPVLSWKSILSEVKTVENGEGIGYDLTKKLTRQTRIAIIPVGYWHGYPRLLSNKGVVYIKGKLSPVLGRVSMDMLVVDVTDIPKVKVGDIAELIGKNAPAKDLAKKSLTSPYEIITRLNPLMKRIYM